MNRLLVQILTPRERLFGVRERLSEGSTSGEIVLTFLGLAAFLLFLYIVFGVQRRHRRTEVDDSRKLFRSLLTDLGLTVRQRDLLRRIAGDLRLQEPSVLLLAPAIYWSYAQQWMADFPNRQPNARAEFEKLAAVLFPQASCGS